MSLPFKPLAHRLRTGDVLPFQIINRLGERLEDARAAMHEQHWPTGQAAGRQRPERAGVPIAAQYWIAPPAANRDRAGEWARLTPRWSAGPWDDTCRWEINLPDDWPFAGFGRLRVGLSSSVTGVRVALGTTSGVHVFSLTTAAERGTSFASFVANFTHRDIQSIESVLVLAY